MKTPEMIMQARKNIVLERVGRDMAGVQLPYDQWWGMVDQRCKEGLIDDIQYTKALLESIILSIKKEGK